MIFDGNKFTKELERKIVGEGKKLVILVDSENESGKVYSRKKKELGERVGMEVEIVEFKAEDKKRLKELIKNYGEKQSVKGLMIQLPIRGVVKEELQEILDLIPVEKDVDGLTSENLKGIATGEQLFIPATVKAVGKVMDQAIKEVGLDIEKMSVAVVGSKGMVGRPLVMQLKRFGFEVGEFDFGDELKLEDFDVVISAVGKAGLIKDSMLKDGVVVIDVGFPEGDFEKGVEKKAAFFTPVPGGIGPVTVVCLLENVARAGENY